MRTYLRVGKSVLATAVRRPGPTIGRVTDTFSCDYCRGTIETATDAALIVGLHRRVDPGDWGDDPDELASGEQLVFRYCSQQHLGAHMERVPLPPVRIDESISAGGMLGCAVAVLVGAAVLALTVYGAVQLWQDVLQR